MTDSSFITIYNNHDLLSSFYFNKNLTFVIRQKPNKMSPDEIVTKCIIVKLVSLACSNTILRFQTRFQGKNNVCRFKSLSYYRHLAASPNDGDAARWR